MQEDICASRVLGIEPVRLSKLLESVARRTEELLQECRGDQKLCNLLLNELKRLADADALFIAPALIVDEKGETVEAFYTEKSINAIVVSPHILLDREYAAHTLLHELVHAAGLADEDETEALALFTTNRDESPEAPIPVKNAEQKLRNENCTISIKKLLELL